MWALMPFDLFGLRMLQSLHLLLLLAQLFGLRFCLAFDDDAPIAYELRVALEEAEGRREAGGIINGRHEVNAAR